jgi:hypothetical protein
MSVQLASASRVTAVHFRSWKVAPTMPAAAQALRQEARKPSDVHGWPGRADRYADAPLSLGLPQPDARAVVSLLCQP